MECLSCRTRLVVMDERQRPLSLQCAFCGQWSVVYEGEELGPEEPDLVKPREMA